MELVKMGKDKYLIKGTGIIISEQERVEQGIIIENKGCENCSKKKDIKKTNKKAKKEIKPVAKEIEKEQVEEIIEEQPIESEVEENDIIEETTETI